MTDAAYDTLAEKIFDRATTSPFLVGVAGAVAVGKTTIVRTLVQALSTRGRSVRVLSTDAFLLPNHVMNERGLLMRKGFPETYDHAAIAAVLACLRSGQATTLNVYSHDVYDILAGVTEPIAPADVVLIDGVMALQQPTLRYLDLAVYIDAPEGFVRQWYVQRFLKLTAAGATDTSSFYHRLSRMPEEQVRRLAEAVWETINRPNLHDHIAPSASNADIVVVKAADHSIVEVRTD